MDPKQKEVTDWCAQLLIQRGITFNSLQTVFQDGTNLCVLAEIISGQPIQKKWTKTIKSNAFGKIQARENINFALDHLKSYFSSSKKPKVIEGISAEEIEKGNIMVIITLLWNLKNFGNDEERKKRVEKNLVKLSTIFTQNITSLTKVTPKTEISFETQKEAVIYWCQKSTKEFPNAAIEDNSSSSWSSCLPFCALLNHFDPTLLPISDFDKTTPDEAYDLSFGFMEKKGIPIHLQKNEIVSVQFPNKDKILAQAAEIYFYGKDVRPTRSMMIPKDQPKTMDIMFVIDSTGSMCDVIQDTHQVAETIVNHLRNNNPNISFQFGCVCYRDPIDNPSELTDFFDLSPDVHLLVSFLSKVEASGGGYEDFPYEDVYSGLKMALDKPKWRKGPKAIIFIADAPGHGFPYDNNSAPLFANQAPLLLNLMKQISAQNIAFTGISIINNINQGCIDCLRQMKERYENNSCFNCYIEEFDLSGLGGLGPTIINESCGIASLTIEQFYQ